MKGDEKKYCIRVCCAAIVLPFSIVFLCARHARRCDLNKLMKGSWLMPTRTRTRARTPKAPKEIFEHIFTRRCERPTCVSAAFDWICWFQAARRRCDERRKRDRHLSLGHPPIEFIHLKIWQTAKNQSPLNYVNARKFARKVYGILMPIHNITHDWRHFRREKKKRFGFRKGEWRNIKFFIWYSEWSECARN